MPTPTDRLLSEQWHLRSTGPGRFDLNVLGVWDPAEGPAFTGAGTRTAVIDDGFDYEHRDLAPNYNADLDFDFANDTDDAFGTESDQHGTAVAGIIGAAANGRGAVGVAHETELVGYRVEFARTFEGDIRDAIRTAATDGGADVMNLSLGTFGPYAYGRGFRQIADVDRHRGRGGPGRARRDDREGGGELPLGLLRPQRRPLGPRHAHGPRERRRPGRLRLRLLELRRRPAGLGVRHAGGGGHHRSHRRPPAIRQPDYTRDFDGTSAAAPMVSGVVALMYDANENLGWRDVQSILAASARHVGSEIGERPGGAELFAWGWNAAETWNGGGQHFSNDYGYGLVDALAAVRLAESWHLTGAGPATSLDQATTRLDLARRRHRHSGRPPARDDLRRDHGLRPRRRARERQDRLLHHLRRRPRPLCHLARRNPLHAGRGRRRRPGLQAILDLRFRRRSAASDRRAPGRCVSSTTLRSTSSSSATSSSASTAPTPSTIATSSPRSIPSTRASRATRPTSSTPTAEATR